MKKHLKYLSYVLRHKYYVFVAGNKVGCSFWRLIKHDWTKFLPCEWFPYVESFYGKYKYKERPPSLVEAFDKAWLHHQHWNDHHWQHWILKEDSGKLKLLTIPSCCIKEMVADWAGAGRAITGKWDVYVWFRANKDKMQIEPESLATIELYLERFFHRDF